MTHPEIHSEPTKLRAGLEVRFAFDAEQSAIRCEWTPCTPGRLSNAELDAYRRARDAFLKQVSARLGGAIAVLEL